MAINMPITHKPLIGHCNKISSPKIKEQRPANNNQPHPRACFIENAMMTRVIPMIMSSQAMKAVSKVEARRGS